MPADHRVRADEGEGFSPARPPAAEENPEETVLPSNPRAPSTSEEGGQLLAERQVLKEELLATPQEVEHEGEQRAEHGAQTLREGRGAVKQAPPPSGKRESPESPRDSRASQFWRTTG